MEQIKGIENTGSTCYNKKQRKLRLKEIKDDELIRLYVNDGLSVYSIAQLTDYNYMTIRYRLIRAGVYIKGGHKTNNIVKGE